MNYLLAFLLIVLGAAAANAGCVWKFECPAAGACRQVPICDSAIDLVPIKPLRMAPLVLPPVAPIAPVVLPPLGTRSCRQAYICNSMGQCGYQTVCQ